MSSKLIKATPAFEFLSGGGEMGERIRMFDWSKTSLGPFELWPQNLRTCIRIMLSSRQPIWIGWGKDLIKFYNDPYKGIVGGKNLWALGSPASVVWKDIWKDIEPMLYQVMEKGEGTYVESQLLVMERNGYPEETYYTFSYTPIPGDHGNIEGMFCANTDDTDKIINERQFRTLTQLGKRLSDCRSNDEVAERTIATLSENPYDFPFAFFRIIKDQKAILTHTTNLGESKGDIDEIIDLESNHVIAEAIKAAIHKNEPYLFDHLIEKIGKLPKGAWEVHTDKGMILPILQTGSKEPFGLLIVGLNPYRLPNESYIGFLNLISDQVATSFDDVHIIEQERKRAEALAEIDRAKTIFFSNISHEFRTPLTLMVAPIEDVLNDPKARDLDKERLVVAHRNVQRLLKLVNNLLDFSRIEAGRMQTHFENTNLSLVTIDLASVFRSAIEKAGIRLVLEIQPDIIAVVDRDMWEKIVLNLISNAFKYTHQGTITVSLERKNDFINLSVSDTGVGIADNQLEKVFERFHRIQNTGGRSQEGTGIGLSLVQELVKLHQGTISVKSRLGHGTIFTVLLPIQPEVNTEKVKNTTTTSSLSPKADHYISEALKWLPLEEKEQLEKFSDEIEIAPVLQHRFAKPKVIVADDNEDMRSYLSRLLEKAFEVKSFRNGQDAYEEAIVWQPDLVLSDVMMPIMNGFELVHQLKQHPQTHLIPIILLSARAGEEARIEGLQSGADDYLIKPFSSRELVSRIESSIKIAESRIHAARQLYQLFMNAPIAIALLRGKEQRFELANERYLEIAGKENVIGKKLQEAFPELRDNSILKILDEVYEKGVPFTGNEYLVELVRKGKKEEVYFNFVYSPLREVDEQVTGVMVVAIDVTEMVKARKILEENEIRLENMVQQRTQELLSVNQSLEQTNQELEQYAYVTSHDLQEPLRKVLIFNNMIVDRYGKDFNDEVKKFHAKINESAHRMSGLIKDLLNYSRVTQNTKLFKPVSLHQIVQTVLKDVELIIEEKKATIKIDSLPVVEAIPHQMEQLFYNLISNAIKFSRMNVAPLVEISCEQLTRDEVLKYSVLQKDKNYVCIRVKDNGIGFNQQHANKMFTMFQQLNERSLYSGHGIGLAICQKVVKNHGGLIFAEGKEQEGAVFNVVLVQGEGLPF